MSGKPKLQDVKQRLAKRRATGVTR